LELCERPLRGTLSTRGRYAAFFELLEILDSADQTHTQDKNALPSDIVAILDYIDAHLSDVLTQRALAQVFYTTPSTLERRFSEVLGMHVAVFIRKRRLSVAARLLEEGCSVTEAGESVGYTDNSHFIKRFREQCGMTPLQYKKKYDGMKNRPCNPDGHLL